MTSICIILINLSNFRYHSLYTLAKGNTFKHKRAIVEEIHKQKAEYVLLRFMAYEIERNAANFFKIKWRLAVSRARLPASDDKTEFSRNELPLVKTKPMLLQRRSRLHLEWFCLVVGLSDMHNVVCNPCSRITNILFICALCFRRLSCVYSTCSTM